MAKNKIMTNEEYIKNGGLNCPHCKSDNTRGESAEIEAGSATQNCYCVDCGSEWTDIYKLTGFDNLTLEKGE